ncbi:MAG TPA: PadR family transcriptional regulator [Lachnospiraceae bacterium]|nr:PadR family transcriptional regulator [Lachnospiraceae bacterium]
MKIPFYLLGLLIRYGPQHGYSLKQLIEERISDFAKIKLPTIYYHLQKLKEQGYVSESLDKDGNRPEKYVYTITEKGYQYFDILFDKQLRESYSPEFALDGVLFFNERIDKERFLMELQTKKEVLIERISQLEFHKAMAMERMPESGRLPANLIFEHHQDHLNAELSWLEKAIKGLS